MFKLSENKYWIVLTIFFISSFIITMNLINYNFSIIYLLGIIITVLALLKIFPFFINRMLARKLVGKDMNKLNKPEIAEMGGILVLFGFISIILYSVFLFTYSNLIHSTLNLHVLLAGILTIILVGLIGLFDDLIGWRKGIRQWQHALFPLFAALPLMAIKVGTTNMNFPIIGSIELGIIYSLVLIPIGITGASNAFNMLAGLNGLEAGQGIIILSTLGIISFFEGQTEALLIAIALIASLLAFIKYNWFPAKIFGGDSLTLMIGAGIATITIIGNMEKLGIWLLLLYFIELVFKAKHKFQSQCFGIPQKNGVLKANPKGGSLTQFIMSKGKFTEKQVVLIILGMQLLIASIGIVFYFMGVMKF